MSLKQLKADPFKEKFWVDVIIIIELIVKYDEIV